MKKFGKAALCVLCAAVLLAMGLFLFKHNSPLYQYIGTDNAIFMTIGRGMAQGKVPYVELTENKGPLFFLLMGVPQMIIEGTTGVFILEEIMLLGMCLMIVLCARWLTGGKPWALCAALGVAAYLSSMNGGNFCEEYDQFFLMMGVTVMVHVFTAQKKGEKWRSFVMGLATASVALIKISDILGLAMLVLCYIAWVIREKKGFWKEALRFVAGMAVVAIPVFAYLISVEAVGAMFEDYILNNFVHVAKGKGYGFMETRLYLLERSYGRTALKAVGGMIAAVIVCLLLKFGKRDGDEIQTGGLYTAAVLMALGNLLVAFVASSGFYHHLMMGDITNLLTILLISSAILRRVSVWKPVRWVQLGAAVLVLCLSVNAVVQSINPEEWVGSESRQSSRDYQRELLPELEGYEDSVYSIGIYPEWYWETGLYPAYRYFNIIGFIVDNVGNDQAQAFEDYLLEGELQALVIAGDIEEYRGILTDATIDYIWENYIYYTSDSEDARQLWFLI